MIPLQGTLETAILKSGYSGDTAIGNIVRTNDMIYVTHGMSALERGINEVLVRTDTLNGALRNFDYSSLKAQTGNVISSQIPPEIQERGSLDGGTYILWGVLPWKGNRPDLAEINKTFDPGNMSAVPYFISSNNCRVIRFGDPKLDLTNYEGAVKYLWGNTDPIKNSRTILVASEDQVYELEAAIRDRKIIPVRMEPLYAAGQNTAARQIQPGTAEHALPK